MFILYSVVGLLGPLLGLGVLAASVVVIWRAVTLPRGSRRAPACERCRYEVAELTTFTCPECGGDLRQVGIITPAMEVRRRGSLALAVLGWTILCGSLAYMVFIFSFFFIGFTSVQSVQGQSSQIDLTPLSGSYRSVSLAYDTDYASITSELELGLTLNDGATRWLTLDPGPMTVEGLPGGTAAWDGGAVERFFADAGLDVDDAQVKADARELQRFVDAILVAPSAAYGGNMVQHAVQHGSTTATMAGPAAAFGPSAAWLLAGLAVLAIVYVVGLLWIVSRRRTLVRTHGAA